MFAALNILNGFTYLFGTRSLDTAYHAAIAALGKNATIDQEQSAALLYLNGVHELGFAHIGYAGAIVIALAIALIWIGRLPAEKTQ